MPAAGILHGGDSALVQQGVEQGFIAINFCQLQAPGTRPSCLSIKETQQWVMEDKPPSMQPFLLPHLHPGGAGLPLPDGLWHGWGLGIQWCMAETCIWEMLPGSLCMGVHREFFFKKLF